MNFHHVYRTQALVKSWGNFPACSFGLCVVPLFFLYNFIFPYPNFQSTTSLFILLSTLKLVHGAPLFGFSHCFPRITDISLKHKCVSVSASKRTCFLPENGLASLSGFITFLLLKMALKIFL